MSVKNACWITDSTETHAHSAQVITRKRNGEKHA